MSGRQGICDTAACTSKCGYNQRKTIKHNEDCLINSDDTVRDSDDNILMLKNNGIGFLPGIDEDYISFALKNIIESVKQK